VGVAPVDAINFRRLAEPGAGLLATFAGLVTFNKCCGMSARYYNRVAGIAADAAGFSQGFEQGNAAFPLRKTIGCGTAPTIVIGRLLCSFTVTPTPMTYQAIGFQNFGDLLLRLDFRRARDPETNRTRGIPIVADCLPAIRESALVHQTRRCPKSRPFP